MRSASSRAHSPHSLASRVVFSGPKQSPDIAESVAGRQPAFCPTDRPLKAHAKHSMVLVAPRRPAPRWAHGGLLSATALVLALLAAGCGSAHTAAVVLPTATRSSVAITTDFASYSVSQAIGVTVMNSAKVAYYGADNHTECTVLQLQEQVRGVWTDILPCATGQQADVLEIAPGAGVPYTLAPGNAHDSPNAWDPGVYRVALLFGAKADGSNLTTTVYSAGFQIHAA